MAVHKQNYGHSLSWVELEAGRAEHSFNGGYILILQEVMQVYARYQYELDDTISRSYHYEQQKGWTDLWLRGGFGWRNFYGG